MGILLGWIIQKRRLTLAAFLLLVIGSLILPRLPSPLSYSALISPGVFLAALLYENSAQFGLRIDQRVRLAWSVWMGLSALVLMTGIVLGGSNQVWFFATIAVFLLLTLPSIIAVGLLHRRRVNEE